MFASPFFKNLMLKSLFMLCIVAVGLGVGLLSKDGIEWYLSVPIIAEINGEKHFQSVNEKVVIYTAEWCPYCKKLKQYLTEKGISYEDRDIEHGNQAVKELYASLGQPGIPKIVIGNKVINGFSQKVLDIEIAKLQAD